MSCRGNFRWESHFGITDVISTTMCSRGSEDPVAQDVLSLCLGNPSNLTIQGKIAVFQGHWAGSEEPPGYRSCHCQDCSQVAYTQEHDCTYEDGSIWNPNGEVRCRFKKTHVEGCPLAYQIWCVRFVLVIRGSLQARLARPPASQKSTHSETPGMAMAFSSKPFGYVVFREHAFQVETEGLGHDSHLEVGMIR